MGLSGFVFFLYLALMKNWVAILATTGILLLMFARGVDQRVSMAFASFFFGGAAVAHLQWMIFSQRDASEAGWYIFGTIALVSITSTIGAYYGWRYVKEEKLIPVIMIMTAVLAFFQFGGFTDQELNFYARVYAVVCLAAPVIVIVRGPKKYRNQKPPSGLN